MTYGGEKFTTYRQILFHQKSSDELKRKNFKYMYITHFHFDFDQLTNITVEHGKLKYILVKSTCR